jgi:hypothetical protein
MALLVTQTVTQAGTVPAFVAASAGGDTMVPGPTTSLRVKNGGGAPVTVTLDSVAPCSQGFDHNLTVAVAAGAEAEIGPIDAARFAQPSTGLAAITYSGVTSVTVAVMA